MKKLSEIPPIAPDDIQPAEGKWKQDLLIEKLENEGLKPIAVGRAIVVITQCDPEDEISQRGFVKTRLN